MPLVLWEWARAAAIATGCWGSGAEAEGGAGLCAD